MHIEMIYLDNAATSRYKPKCVIDALTYDIANSANAGRAGHKESVLKTLAIDECRLFLLEKFGCKDEYDVIFTKNCTEALNMAIFGYLNYSNKAVTTKNEHNSVLRPLTKLQNDGKISLAIARLDATAHIDYADLKEKSKGAKMIVAGGASNVTGAIADLEKMGKIAKDCGAKLLVDGAQSVPIVDIDMLALGIDMLAVPAHKGLHGVQGIGALVVKKDIELQPLLYGGTGARSNELLPSVQMPESFEAGTQFSGGICALHKGAEWTWNNLQTIRKNTIRLSKNLVYALKHLGATVYTSDFDTGVVGFNFSKIDSSFIADALDDYGICVRSGLHCAPLTHQSLETLDQGVVRASIGCDTTDKEINVFVTVLEKIVRKINS